MVFHWKVNVGITWNFRAGKIFIMNMIFLVSFCYMFITGLQQNNIFDIADIALYLKFHSISFILFGSCCKTTNSYDSLTKDRKNYKIKLIFFKKKDRKNILLY